MLSELLVTAIIIAIVFLCFRQNRPPRFPPGPFSWPVIGNFGHIGLEPHKRIMTFRKKYGDIIAIDFGSKRGVFITDYKLIKEAFNLPLCCGRPRMYHYLDKDTGKCRGIATTNGKMWSEQRRFAFSCIQSGFRNGQSMENAILKEINELIQHLKEIGNQPISTEHTFSISVVNSLWTVVTGERYSVSDPIFQKITKHANGLLTNVAAQGVLLVFPILGKFFPKLSGYERLISDLNPIREFVQDIIDAHRRTYCKGIQRDLIDCYLEKICSTTDPESGFFQKTGEVNMRFGLVDIFLGGTETVATTLRWLIFLLAYYPDTQEKLNYITSQYYGNDGISPSLKDRLRLPYVEAVIMEVSRISSIAQVGFLHETLDDVEFHGYLLPKGTLIFANQHGAHYDPEVWGDPENFRPERFLTEDKTEVIHHPALIPFSVGRRVCPGEALSKDQLFLFTVSLVRSFRFEFDHNTPKPSSKYTVNATLPPVDHQIIFHDRFP